MDTAFKSLGQVREPNSLQPGKEYNQEIISTNTYWTATV